MERCQTTGARLGRVESGEQLTRAKVGGRAPYLAPELWDLFRDRLGDGGKPDGWEVSNIGKEANAAGGATPNTKEPVYWENGEYHWATPATGYSRVAPSSNISRSHPASISLASQASAEMGAARLSGGVRDCGCLRS